MAEQLTCGACGFANEPERVYCHNCGAKLDRSLLPTVEAEKNSESAEAARKRIRRMTNPAGLSPAMLLKQLLTTLLLAALVACLLLIFRPPEGLPENKNELPSRLVQSELMEATQSPTPRTLAFSEADVNGAFKQMQRRAAANGGLSGVIPGLSVSRAYALLHPGVLHIGTEQEVGGGLAIHSGIDFQLAVVGGKFTPTVVGGNLGRLRIHPQLMKYADTLFSGVWTNFKREHDQMARVQNVVITKGTIVLVTKGAGAP